MAKKDIGVISYSDTAPKHYIVNAGAIYKNLTFTGEKWQGELLGATAGGSKISIKVEFRKIEVDGVYVDAKGQKVLSKATAMLETNVKQLTADVFKHALLGKATAGDGTNTGPEEAQIITGKGKIEDSDYLDNIALVATLTGSDKPVIFILDNALCTSGLELSTKDDAEATVKLVFEAHANAEQLQDRTLPARIVYPQVS